MSTTPPMSDLNGLEIAVIGLSCRFPGANTPDEFWQNLRDGVESISFLQADEIEQSTLDPTTLDDPNYVKAASVIDGVEQFDAAFFGITPKEAEVMDPQHRLFLECAWEALEHAGYDPEQYKDPIGVYSGARTNTYLFNLYSNQPAVGSLSSFEVGLGNDLAFLSTRTSYKLNLKGPACSVHTACSTALVAVHLACQGLLSDECRIAIAGGIAVNVPQKTGYLYQHGGIVSPDGHCRAFDAKAQGTIFGSGVGIVVLKRLEDALADGDTIHAVIKGSAINNDGAVKASFTAPSVHGQAKVIIDALASAEVDADTISYVEAHGTGTALGDPIEIRALTKAFRTQTPLTHFCAIGSVKTNIGHLDAAAGIASLIKAILALKHRQLPPSLHFEQPNPQIDFSATPFYVNTELRPWASGELPRRAGVSAFGIGGTNAHVILEEAPPMIATVSERPYHLLVLSAKTNSALEAATSNLGAYLAQQPDIAEADLSYTLQVGRQAFNHRRVMVCRDREHAIALLNMQEPHNVWTDVVETTRRPVAFLFSGQGTQYVNMTRDLYETEDVFRQTVDQCASILHQHLACDLREVLYAASEDVERNTQRLNQTELAQPALFVIEYALARLFMAWGVEPEAMTGHSLGEYVAACLAGVMSLDDALLLVAARGRLMQTVPTGAMVAVSLPEADVQQLLGEELSLAAVNGPGLCIVSGPTATIERLEAQLSVDHINYRRLHTSHAFHSAMMDSILDTFAAQVRRISLQPPQIPYLSNLTGTWITPAEATDPLYWVNHLRQTVRFSQGVRELLKEPTRILLEIGPGQSLSTIAKLHTSHIDSRAILNSVRHPRDLQSDVAVVLTTLGKLWLAGVAIKWPKLYPSNDRRRIPLPGYPFERQRYWIDAGERSDHLPANQGATGKQADIANWFYLPSWERSLPAGLQPDIFAERRCWLMLLDQIGVGAALAQRLEQEGQDVIRVLAADAFKDEGNRRFTINPCAPEQYVALLQALQAQGLKPQVVVHLWSLMVAPEAPSEAAFFNQVQNLGYYSLLFLGQALASVIPTASIRIEIISDRVHAVNDEDHTLPEKATMLGPCKVIPQEHQHIACRCIDIGVSPTGTAQAERLNHQLLSEISTSSQDMCVAYRGNKRWVQTFLPIRLPGDTPPITPLRQRGVYLITGGLGGVGLLLAESLASTVQARLILIGRSTLPARSTWDSWLAEHADDDKVSRQIRKVQGLEALGAEVMLISADVADAEQMRAVMAQINTRFGELHGVLHAAGITSGPSLYNALTDIGREQSDMQFQPKVYGLYVLAQVLAGTALDFCLLFSSNAAVLGGLGYLTYAAANLFMDAFAVQRSRTSNIPWISANWDPWPEDTKHYVGVQTSMDRYAMSPAESAEAFRRIVTLGLDGQIVVATGDLPQRLAVWINRSVAAENVTAATASAYQRPKSQSVYVAPSNDVEQTIVGIWEDILGIQQIGIHDNFFDLGGHSLLATKLITRLRDTFQINLPLGSFFEAPTIAGLARAIATQTAEQADHEDQEILAMLAQLSDEEAASELTRRGNLVG